MTKISTITAGKTNRSVCAARTWCSNSPLHSMCTPFGQRHLLGDDALGLLDEADDVAAADVQRDVVEQPAVLALDHRRPFDDAHVGHGA